MAANIQSKKKPVIESSSSFSYNPATFKKEHWMDNFYEVEDPQFILDNIKPLEFMGMRLVSFDTEAHPYFKNSHDVPKGVVRRWIGSGKTAKPIDYPFSIQVCDGTNAYCIYDTLENGFAKFKALKPLFEDPTIDKIAHNTKFDMHMTQNAKMKIVGKLHDTVVLSKITNENRPGFDLWGLAKRMDKGIVKYEQMVEIYKQVNKIVDYRDIPRELLTMYGCADVWNCIWAFVKEYTSMIEQDATSKPGQRLQDVYNREMECMIALYSMERKGMRADLSYEMPLIEQLQKEADDAERDVYAIAGRVFNMNSTKQLYDVMLSLGVDSSLIQSTEKGNPKLDKDAMAKLDEVYNIPIVSKVLAYKKAEKLLTTYAIGIYSQRSAAGTVHGSINQTEAVTGRMSITKPALQTLPKKNKSIRKIFIPEDNYKLYFMDLDQVEYRGFAHYSKSFDLIDAINNGHDIHAATAATIFHTALTELIAGMEEHNRLEVEKKRRLIEGATEEDLVDITEAINKLQAYVDMRSKGKTINFALIYGVGNDHLADLLRVTKTEAEQLKATYFANLPDAKTFINTVHSVIKQRGYTTNFYGRRRRLKSDEAYKAPNALIQGWAADYIKDKMANMYKYMRYNNLKSHLLIIVHDELGMAVHKDEEEHIPAFRWLLSDFDTYRCKITAGVEYGDPSWGQKKAPIEDVGFVEPADKGYLEYNVFDGSVFDIE